MVPLSKQDGRKRKTLNLFEVRDAETQQTLDSLFMEQEAIKNDHTSCILTESGAVVCGSDSDLLYVAAPACINSSGLFFGTTSSMKYSEGTIDCQ
mmetsp:Transcript_10339/g.14100  ORF Transcript_10339/g.14100 Transcript_10339/m.14100 type:complete len:95 (-) Transcript_10339:59-343(-)